MFISTSHMYELVEIRLEWIFWVQLICSIFWSKVMMIESVQWVIISLWNLHKNFNFITGEMRILLWWLHLFRWYPSRNVSREHFVSKIGHLMLENGWWGEMAMELFFYQLYGSPYIYWKDIVLLVTFHVMLTLLLRFGKNNLQQT